MDQDNELLPHTDSIRWDSVDVSRPISDDEIHIWRVDRRSPPLSLELLAQFLTRDERQRRQQSLLPEVRNLRMMSRGLLRYLLAGYLRCPPHSVPIIAGSRGKPGLTRDGAGSGIHFSVSHSHELLVYAFCRGNPVGIDVELLNSGIEIDVLAGRFFSATEIRDLQKLQGREQEIGFYACWTRKEAYLKLKGDGLHRSLSSFSVALLPGEPPRLYACEDDPDDCVKFTFRSFTPAEGYCAALALPEHIQRIHWYCPEPAQ